MFCFTTIRINKKKEKNKVKRSMALFVEEALVLHHQMTHAYKSLSYFTVCEHNGKQYKVGENFPKGDNCNRCSCGPNGLVNCTDKYCKKEQCMFCTYT